MINKEMLTVSQHIDFRNKKLSSILLFSKYIAPYFGRYVTSVSHSPIPSSIHLISSPQAKLSHLRELDDAYSLALLNLHAVRSVDLTIPTLDYEGFYYNTLGVLLNFSKVKELTLRSDGFGRGDFISAEDAFNGKSMALLLKAFPNLNSFRALGISGTDLSPE